MSDIPEPPRLHRWVARLRSLLRGILRRSEVESEMEQEFRHHIELRTEDLMRGGLSRKEASRRAHLEFGHVETQKTAARAARGLRLVDQARFSWIDVKLGARMLVKHPGLTVVSVFALAVGIPLGLAPAHLSSALEAPLPEDPGNRLRALRFWDATVQLRRGPTFGDFELWRDELVSFSTLAAFRSSSYAVAADDGRAAAVAGAEVTASIFDVLATRPLLGRTLDAGDEARGAPDVVVIGYDLWLSRFGADPGIVGQAVRLSGVPHAVVGVMPTGFLFPARQQLWVPLPDASLDPENRRQGVGVLGRLADGVTAEEAQAELAATDLARDPELPDEQARLSAEVVPYGFASVNLPRGGLDRVSGYYFFQVLALALLLVACLNVAMLIFARTATRFREMAVRTALGASRARIVSQIFAETLVLAVVATGFGLVTIDWALGRAQAAIVASGVPLPYWLTLEVTTRSIGWALGLAVISAAVAGVLPALRITGKRIHESIRRGGVGRSGIRFGGVTGALIAADVAICVTAVSMAVTLAARMWDKANLKTLVGIPAEEYLALELRLPVSELRAAGGGSDVEYARDRLGATQQRLVERLEAEPAVRSVAVANALPRQDQPSRIVEVQGVDIAGAGPPRYVRTVTVDVDYFRSLDRPILAGRDFDRGDLDADEPPVIVNSVFAERILGGRNPVGRRLRFTTGDRGGAGPWLEITGVVGHLGVNIVNPQGGEAIYVPAPPGWVRPLRFAIHVGDAPATFAPRVREIVAEVDPSAVVDDPAVLSRVYQGDWYIANGVAAGLGLASGVVCLIALLSGLVPVRRMLGIRPGAALRVEG